MGGVTIFVSRILEILAQETGDKVTESAMDAAIQEAVKDIPYPVDEDVSFSHDFGYYNSTGSNGKVTSRTYEIDAGVIAFRKAKRITFNISLTGEYRQYPFLQPETYIGKLYLPSGGTYIQLHKDGGFDFMAGGELVAEVSTYSNSTEVDDGEEVITSVTMYLARLS